MSEQSSEVRNPQLSDPNVEDLDLEGIAQCYCDTYAGEPWHQHFDKEAVLLQFKKLSEREGAHISCTKDGQGKVQSFFIFYEGPVDEVLGEFEETYREVVEVPIGNQPVPTGIVEHTEEVVRKVESALNDLKAERVIHILDLGVRPDKQSDLGVAFGALRSVHKELKKSKSNIAIGQTITVGPMYKFLREISRTLDLFPTTSDSPVQHVTLLFNLSEINLLNLVKKKTENAKN